MKTDADPKLVASYTKRCKKAEKLLDDLLSLLRQHLNEGPHGTATKMARDIDTGRQRLYEWASGKVKPREKMAQTIVEYLKEKHSKPKS